MKTFNETTQNYTTPRGVIITINQQIPIEENEENSKGIQLKTIDLSKHNEKEEIIQILKEMIKNPTQSFDHYENLHEFIDIYEEMKETLKTLSSAVLLFSFDCDDTHDQVPQITIIYETKLSTENETSIIEELQSFMNILKELHTEYVNQPRIYFVRHAMRLDYIDLTWVPNAQYPHDPPLHPTGYQQAEEVGKRMRHENLDVIVTSPNWRSTGTASPIAKYSNMKYGLEPGAEEFLSVNNRVDVPDYDPERLKDPFVDLEYVPVVEKVKLENWSQIQERVINSCIELMKKYKRVCFVTHRSAMQAFISRMEGKLIKTNYEFTSVSSYIPIPEFPYFVPERINSYHHQKTHVDSPLHNPNYYVKDNYKDMIRGPDGNILPAGYY